MIVRIQYWRCYTTWKWPIDFYHDSGKTQMGYNIIF